MHCQGLHKVGQNPELKNTFCTTLDKNDGNTPTGHYLGQIRFYKPTGNWDTGRPLQDGKNLLLF